MRMSLPTTKYGAFRYSKSLLGTELGTTLLAEGIPEMEVYMTPH